MPYAEYWERDPYLVQAYREAHELYREQKNQELYMQGLYNYEAFRSVIDMFSWGLGGRKGAKPDTYREYPHAVTKREREAEKKRSIEKTLAWVRNGQSE
jgi:hypothetical protein